MFLREGGCLNDCIENKYITIIVFREKKVKRDTVYVLFLNDPTKSHSLPFRFSFKFLHREI